MRVTTLETPDSQESLHKRIVELEAQIASLKSERRELLDELERAYELMLGGDMFEQILSLQRETDALNSELRNKIALIERSYDELNTMTTGFIRILGNSVEARDSYTRGHCDRLVAYSQIIGRELGLTRDDLRDLAYGGWLHDIGKIQIEDSILKKPGRLTPDEYERIKEHTIIGWELIRPLKSIGGVPTVIRNHHEKFDGTGYPDGLKGEEIPITARIMCLVDVFDALTTERPYKPAFTLDHALEIIRSESGRHFDPKLVSVLLKSLENGKLVQGQVNFDDSLFTSRR